VSQFARKNLLLVAQLYTENTVVFLWQQLLHEHATVLVIHILPLLFVCFPALVCAGSKALLMWLLPDTVYQRIIKSAYLFIVKTVSVLTIHYMFQPVRL